MRILYAGGQAPGSSSLYRQWALERLGHETIPFDPHAYRIGNRLLQKVAFRLAAGPHAQKLNHDLLALAEQTRPDVVWADKILLMQPRTLLRLRALGVTTISYMIDNAFGPRRDPGWRMYIKCIPFYDLHVTQRDVSVHDLEARGARAALKIQTAYEPTIHFPPPEGWSDVDRNREVSFVGTPYDNRAELLQRLGEEGVAVMISGRETAWRRALSEQAMKRSFFSGLLYDQQYREAIWRSKINLSFLTRANQDEYTHKSFEVAGCGGFLLAERCPGHTERFLEDEQAVFFEGYEELKAKILRWLPDEAGRARIAKAGNLRATRDGYDNDRQMSLILARIEELRRGARP